MSFVVEGAVSPVAPRHVETDPAPETPAIELHRFGLPDLEAKGLWLHSRLCSFLPDLAPNFIAATLSGIMASNEFLFLCAPRAVGLARITKRPLSVVPIAEEVFVFITEDAGVADGLEIYVAMQRWAGSLGAEELIVGTATDIKQSEISKHLGKVKMKTIYAVGVK